MGLRFFYTTRYSLSVRRACKALCILIAGSLLASAAFAAKPYKAPRGPDGKRPDLNGIWQAMNEAN